MVQETMAKWSILFKDRKINESEMNVLLEQFSESFKSIGLRVGDYEEVIKLVTARARFFPTPGEVNDTFNEIIQERRDSQRGYTLIETNRREEQATDEERAERISIVQLVMAGEMSTEEGVRRQQEIADRLAREGRDGICQGPDIHFALGAGRNGVYDSFKSIAEIVKDSLKGQ